MHTYKDWYNWEWISKSRKPVSFFNKWVFKPKNIGLDATLDFKKSVIKALELISDTRSLPIGIFYSGGLDSEIILKTAIEMGLPMQPFTIRFKGGLNEHEIYYTENFSKKFNVDINYIDVDIEQWLFGDEILSCKNQARDYNFCHIATPLHFYARKLVESKFGDFSILNGSGDVPLSLVPDKYNCEKLKWTVGISWDSQYKRLCLSQQYKEDVPLFFCYIPELQYNFLREKELEHCVSENSKKMGVISSRHSLYHRLWPDLLPRKKFTGFEKLDKNFNYSFLNDGGGLRTNYEYRDYLRFFEEMS